MFIKTADKWEAIRAFINMWLKDKTLYCNACGDAYYKELFPCCDTPQIGTNLDHVKGVIEQNKIRRAECRDDHAANKTNTMRWGVSLPSRLYQDLERYCQKTNNQKLFENPKEMRTFARKFKIFAIPERI